MVSFKNFKYSKSLTEFFCPAELIFVGRKPVVFHACCKLSFPDVFAPAKSLALLAAVPLLYLVDTPRKSSLSRIILFVKCTFPKLSMSVLGRV